MRNSNCKRLAVIRIRLNKKKHEKKVEWHRKSLKSTESNVGCAGQGCKMKIMTCVPIMPNKKKGPIWHDPLACEIKLTSAASYIERYVKLEQQEATNVHIENAHTRDPAANVTNAFSAFKPKKKNQKRSKAKQSEWKTYIFPSNQTNERKWSNPIQHPPKFLCTLPKTGWHTKKDEWSDFMKCEHDGLNITVAAS